MSVLLIVDVDLDPDDVFPRYVLTLSSANEKVLHLSPEQAHCLLGGLMAQARLPFQEGQGQRTFRSYVVELGLRIDPPALAITPQEPADFLLAMDAWLDRYFPSLVKEIFPNLREFRMDNIRFRASGGIALYATYFGAQRELNGRQGS